MTTSTTTPFLFRAGDKVCLVASTLATSARPGRRNIKIGTQGEVKARRKEDDGSNAYLVKFKGHSGDRHVAETNLEAAK